MRCLSGIGGLLLCALLAACGNPDFSRESYVFGTRVEITVAEMDEAVAGPAVDAALAELDQLHAELHAWQNSPLAQLNQAIAAGHPAPVTPLIAELIDLGRSSWQQSEGLFNPAIGGLVRAWGFHSDHVAVHIPDAAQLRPWLQDAPSPADITVLDGRATSRKTSVQLDFGGLAKGWALDRLARRLRAAGVKHALINIGGNIMALGQHGERPWRVGLQHPRRAEALLELELFDGEAIGTSGDYQRFFIADGRRYSHLIDPRSGQPATASTSASVLVAPGPQAGMISDVASKPLFIGGPGEAQRMARRFGVRNWLVVAPGGTVYLSQAMQSRVRWLGKPPALIPVQP